MKVIVIPKVTGAALALSLLFTSADLAESAEVKLKSLPKVIRKNKNGPEIGLTSQALKARYGANQSGKLNPLLFTLNFANEDMVDVLVYLKENRAFMVSYTVVAVVGQQPNTLSKEIVDFLVKKNFPNQQWRPAKDPRYKQISEKTFESLDGTLIWSLSKNKTQLLIGKIN
jgi:hypothetical protein